MDRLWWENITNVRLFLDDIIQTILENKSVMLCMPENVPWKQTFLSLVEEKIMLENSKNAFEFLDCPQEEPGKFLLHKYCSKEKRATYRFGVSYAAFLGKSTDIVLNDRYIWIKDIPLNKYREWIDFVAEYTKNVTEKQAAVFILETHDEAALRSAKAGMRKLEFDNSISAYDKYAFCTLVSSSVQCKDYLRAYMSELATSVCGDDIELCGNVVQQGKTFLEHPLQSVLEVVDTMVRSDYTSFTFDKEEEEFNQNIWEAQIKHVFPAIEKYRNFFIKKHYDWIKTCLPIQNSCGESVTNPEDTEIGTLHFLATSRTNTLTQKDRDELTLFKNARNQLAHLYVLDFVDVDQILSKAISYRL